MQIYVLVHRYPKSMPGRDDIWGVYTSLERTQFKAEHALKHSIGSDRGRSWRAAAFFGDVVPDGFAADPAWRISEWDSLTGAVLRWELYPPDGSDYFSIAKIPLDED